MIAYVQAPDPSGRPRCASDPGLSRYCDTMELGVHFALSDHVAAELLDARGDDGKLGAVVEDIEETGRSEFFCDTAKAWDPILCSLSSAGYQRTPENWPAYGVILGYEDLNMDTDDQLITHWRPTGSPKPPRIWTASPNPSSAHATTRCRSMIATPSTARTSARTPGVGWRK